MSDQPVKQFFKKYNIVISQTEFFVPRSCEYYLHFNVNLPYPEKEQQKLLAEQKKGKIMNCQHALEQKKHTV